MTDTDGNNRMVWLVTEVIHGGEAESGFQAFATREEAVDAMSRIGQERKPYAMILRQVPIGAADLVGLIQERDRRIEVLEDTLRDLRRIIDHVVPRRNGGR